MQKQANEVRELSAEELDRVAGGFSIWGGAACDGQAFAAAGVAGIMTGGLMGLWAGGPLGAVEGAGIGGAAGIVGQGAACIVSMFDEHARGRCA